MAIRSLLAERTIVLHDGGRYICRKPTCETVILALGHFGAEILGCRLTYRKNPRAFSIAPVRVVLSNVTDMHHLAVVLATCCELHDGVPGEFEERLIGQGGRELAAKIITGILAVCDLERLIEAAEIDRHVDELEAAPEAGPAPRPEGPSAMELLAASIGERFGVAPHEVMAWPYLQVIDLAETILPALDKMRRGEGPEVFGLSADEWEEEGVTLIH